MIVLDASAATALLLAEGEGDWVEREIADEVIAAPTLLDYEVAAAMRNAAARGRRTPEETQAALVDFGAFEVMRHPAAPLLARIWELRHTVTAYDAAYVALAEALDARLVTTDLRLARSHGHDATIVAP